MRRVSCKLYVDSLYHSVSRIHRVMASDALADSVIDMLVPCIYALKSKPSVIPRMAQSKDMSNSGSRNCTLRFHHRSNPCCQDMPAEKSGASWLGGR